MATAQHRLATALAVLAAGIGLACGRTRLLDEPPDAGPAKDATSPAEAPAIQDGARSRDVTAADLSTDRRDAETPRPDDARVADLPLDVADVRVGRDFAAAEARPVSCVSGPSEPASLAVLDGLGSVLGIVSFGDRLTVGGVVNQAIDLTPRGRVVSISVRDGHMTSDDLDDGIPKDIHAAGPALVYTPGAPQALPGGWRFNYTRVVRSDGESNERLELAQPTGVTLADDSRLTTNAKGEIFWIATGSGESAIAGWDPATGTTSVRARTPSIVDVWADTANLYWKGADETGYVTLTSAPTTGGGKSTLYRSSSTSWTGTPDLVGIDDVDLYYVLSGKPEAGIMAMPKEGGIGRTAVANATPRLPLCLSDQHIYWAEDTDGNAIRRAAKDSGEAELVWSAPNRWIQAMTIDACNVYWVVANPFEVFYRAK
jgi:hypothetical protein